MMLPGECGLKVLSGGCQPQHPLRDQGGWLVPVSLITLYSWECFARSARRWSGAVGDLSVPTSHLREHPARLAGCFGQCCARLAASVSRNRLLRGSQCHVEMAMGASLRACCWAAVGDSCVLLPCPKRSLLAIPPVTPLPIQGGLPGWA